MEAKIAIFWSEFADKFASDERAAKAMSGYARVPIQAARDEIAAAREIVRHIAEHPGRVAK